ncbi:lycopene cyclase domain-containing protein [Cryomorpha ignava]|uniref:Lycopene cyclase domain-containing protein n=1 Tax=Cryomorpha ignava TaxID=101383 RepID=A0A7K3WM18_9FLAO|nr:lycopene cyclase domain-containing protein [Cryomorpha ignava]NEN22071.1 lycopene cyclase domain-containing protein [Cryomorpha ignava]
MEKYTYLLLNILTIALPFFWSFEKKIFFVRYWRGLFLGIAVMILVFVPWDVWFTSMQVWGFNERYITGIKIANLPIEEWLFFITVPYACTFLYETLNYYLPKSPLAGIQDKITAILIFVSFVLSIVFVDRIYTFTTFSLLSLFLIWHLLINRSNFLGQFYLLFVFVQIPFFFVNGALTGMFTDEPIVWYNNAENMGIRLITIPVDDVGYNMLMLLIVITVLEMFKVRILTGALKVT